jgi:hypothetical protein
MVWSFISYRCICEDKIPTSLNTRKLHFSVETVEEKWNTDIHTYNKIQYLLGIYIFFLALRPNAGFGHIILEVSRSHTTTHHSRYDFSVRMISSSQRPVPDKTRHSQQRDIHAPGGIRTHNLSSRAAADLRLRTRGRWDRLGIQICVYMYIYIYIYTHIHIRLRLVINAFATDKTTLITTINQIFAFTPRKRWNPGQKFSSYLT